MSRTVTPTFRIEFAASGGYYTPQAWPTKYEGRPSDAALARWVVGFEAATQPDGCNAHLGVVTIWGARVVRQTDGTVVASYAGPAFAMAA